MSVYKKLNEARAKFHSLQLKKTGHNKFAGYYYFELGDFLIPALTVFREAGLCATVSFEADKASMVIRDVEKPDDCILITSPMGSAALKGCHEVQNIGAVETYQRRYLWVAALEIVEHDALDATTGQEEPARKTKAIPALASAAEDNPVPDEQKPYLDELADELIGIFNAKGKVEAYERMAIEGLDNEQKLYLSTKLPSNVRNGIKAVSMERNKQKEHV